MATKSIGYFLRQFRKSRGFTLNEAVAGSGCSPAALSRFERDKSDLSVTSMQLIMQNLQLTVHDFSYFTSTQNSILNDNTFFAFIKGDQDALKNNAKEFMQINASKLALRPIKYAAFLLTVSQKIDAANYRLSPDEEQMLSDFVAPFPSWNNVHTLAITAALRFASSDLLALITHRLIDYTRDFTAENIKESAVDSYALGFLLINLIVHRQIELAQELRTAMVAYHDIRIQHDKPDHIAASALNSSPIVDFSAAALDWLLGPTAANEAHALRIVQQVRNLAATGLATYFDRTWLVIKAGKPAWNNHTLSDNHADHQGTFDLTTWKFSGPNIHKLRQFYGLTLDDVSVDWQTATQSRFENSKTKLGFRDSLRLLAELMLSPKFFYQTIFPEPFADFTAAAYDTHDPDVLLRVERAYNVAKANLPTKPAARHDLLTGALITRANWALDASNVATDQRGDIPPISTVEHYAMQGLISNEKIQTSDLMAFGDCAGPISAPNFVRAMKWIITHAAVDVQKQNVIIELFYFTVGSQLYEENYPEKYQEIARLRKMISALDFDRFSIAFGVSYSLADILIRLFAGEAHYAENKALFWANVQAMHEFTRKTPPAHHIFGARYDNYISFIPDADALHAQRKH